MFNETSEGDEDLNRRRMGFEATAIANVLLDTKIPNFPNFSKIAAKIIEHCP